MTIRPNAFLDTCALIDILRGKHKDLEQKTQALDISKCAIADIAVFELLCAAEKSAHRESNREAVLNLTDFFQKRSVSAGFELAATEKIRLQKEGTPIEDIDLLIGCLCASEDIPLVTSNISNMERIKGIKLIPW